MKIVVLTKMIPDLVEELSIDESGCKLDRSWMRLILNEFDHHAIEQAILIKEAAGAEVVVVAPDVDEAEDVLFSAAAIGADQLIKLTGLDEEVSNHGLARLCLPLMENLRPDLILTGVQAHNDLDGQLGPILAEYLDYPYMGYIAGLTLDNGHALAKKEFPGGLVAEMEFQLPAVIGIQAAQNPPRYVAFSRIRQARNTADIEEYQVGTLDEQKELVITRMAQPEVGQRAEMLEGTPEEVTSQLLDILHEKGIL